MRSSKRSSEDSELSLHKTASLELAAYFCAAQLLELHRIEPGQHHAEFFFLDPGGRGPALATQYHTQDIKVSAKLLWATRSNLLNEIRGRR